MSYRRLVLLLAAGAAVLSGQVSRSAYRVLGQPDLRQNGVNRVQGTEFNTPAGLDLDTRDGRTRLYVADGRNHRVLAWGDAGSYQNGNPPDLVLGQSSPRASRAMGIGAKGFNSPSSVAVDPLTGDLYVADTGNHRVLRFAAPFARPSTVEPETVIGQPDFATYTAGVGPASLNTPRGLAVDRQGNLWVADTGNHRVLRFPAGALRSGAAAADLVLGQRDFTSNTADRGAATSAAGLNTPAAVAVDTGGNVYVADWLNARVLRFQAPVVSSAEASAVYGQPNLTSRGVPRQPTSASMTGPAGVTVDAFGNLWVAVPLDNRVLVFGADPAAPARDVYGQPDFATNTANAASFPLASAATLAAPNDVKLDGQGNVFVADTGNHRVVEFAAGAKPAAKVWGQPDFISNGANQVKASSIDAPYKMAVDYSREPFALYVSDTNNHRVLGWRDATKFRAGEPADLVIGQPSFSTNIPNIDTRATAKPAATSLAGPRGIAVDARGNLWVADTANNRVLRYARPVDQTGRVTPDVVLGQADFASSDSAAISAWSLKQPNSVSVGADGRVLVADTGNHRVLEFAADPGTRAAAQRVYGQANFESALAGFPPSAQSLAAPGGVYVDAYADVYVADTGNNRVLVYVNTRSAPAAGMAASLVFGQDSFETNAGGTAAARLRAPVDVATDGEGIVYVSENGNHRVSVFAPLLYVSPLGAGAFSVVGQRTLTASAVNWNSTDGFATAESLYAPAGIFVDRRNTLYVGDTGNSRVLHFLQSVTLLHPAYEQSGMPVAPGSLAVMRGGVLADAEESAAAGRTSGTLASREVLFNETLRAPLAAVKRDRIDLQVPSAVPAGTAAMLVRATDTGELIAGAPVPVLATVPGLFWGGDEKQFRAVLNEDGKPNSSTNPAEKGSTIKIFGTGQGAVNPAVADGEPAAGSTRTAASPTTSGRTCLTEAAAVCVAVGNTFAEISFSGLASGAVGIWELDVKIPGNALSGAIPVRAVINGAPTNIIGVYIK